MGAIAELVMINPSAGFVNMPTSFFFGVFGAVIGRQALRIKFSKSAQRLRWVDIGDSFVTHFILGTVDTIATDSLHKKKLLRITELP